MPPDTEPLAAVPEHAEPITPAAGGGDSTVPVAPNPPPVDDGSPSVPASQPAPALAARTHEPTEDGRLRPSGRRLTVARVLSGVGRTLIGAGLIILLFVAYQLWGTNLQEQRSQNELEDDFEATLEQLDQVDPSVLAGLREPEPQATPASGPAPTPAAIPREVVELLSPQAGEAMAVIRIPKIRVERRVVQGTEVDDLRKGPGHYPESPLPGQKGNAAIAGHRTTYGAPFNRIDELGPGDEIQVQTVQGTAVYRVDKAPFVVSPNQVEVLDDVGDNRLTLTSCHPKLSARERLIVTALLVSEPFAELPAAEARVQTDIASTTTVAEAVENLPDPTAATAPVTTPGAPTSSPATTAATDTEAEDVTVGDAGNPPGGRSNLDQGLAGDRGAIGPAAGWGAVAAAVALAAWLVARAWDRHAGEPRRRRRVLVYGLASPLFALVLFLCFENVDRILPAF